MVKIGAGGKAHTVIFVAGAPADKIVRHILPECHTFARKASEQPLRPRIVAIDAGDVALVEKARFCLAIGFHRAVIVEVILRQIRKNADAKADPLHPFLHQRMGGDLHHRVSTARIDHLGEQALQGQRVGRGALCRNGTFSDQVLIRADESDLRALRALQQLLDQTGRGRFAVRAGHTDHGEFSRRSTIPYRRAKRKRFVRIRHKNVGDLRFRRLLAHGADRAARLCFGDIVAAVLFFPRQGEKERSFPRFAGIERKAADRQILRRTHFLFFQYGNKLR